MGNKAEINRLEQKFSDTENLVATPGIIVNGYDNGRIPILISAPHTIRYTRADGEVKLPELYTGALTRWLHAKVHAHIVYRTGFSDDPVLSEAYYREGIRRVLEHHKIALFIELHGCKDSHGFDIEIGTNDGDNIVQHKHIEWLLQEFFEKEGIGNVVINEKFKASEDYTNCKWVHDTFGISAIQIEISHAHRKREDLDKFFDVAAALQKFIEYLAPVAAHELLICSLRETKRIAPHNRLDLRIAAAANIEIGTNYFLDRIDNHCVVTTTKVMPGEGQLPVAEVTKRVFERRESDNKIVALVAHASAEATYLKPPHERILEMNECIISGDLSKALDNPEGIRIKSRYNKSIGYFKVVETREKTGKFVYLHYAQRKLLGLEIPNILTAPKYNELCSRDEIFRDKYEQQDTKYRFKITETEEYHELSKIFKQHHGKFDVSAFNGEEPGNKKQFFDSVIGKKEISLMACRALSIDESKKIVRVSKDNLKVLGVEEGDKIIIESHLGIVKAIVLCFENAAYLATENGFSDGADSEFVISIPVSLRGEIGLGDIGQIVRVKRDTYFLLMKNINTQFFSVLGLVIAIFSLPDSWGDYFKSCLTIVLLPVILWLTFSKERSKVS